MKTFKLLSIFSQMVFLSCFPLVLSAQTISKDYISQTIGVLKYVPEGTFHRDDNPDNTSTIVGGFRIAQTEVTRSQFLAIIGVDPSNKDFSKGMNDPVIGVCWYHAITFCNKLSLKEGLKPVYTVIINGSPIDFSKLKYSDIPGDQMDMTNAKAWNEAKPDWSANGYRLPTEMEWAWAAMGGQDKPINLRTFAGANGNNSITDYSIYQDGKAKGTQPVKSKLPNELGIFDMSGNIIEWCWDWFAPYPTGPIYSNLDNGRGPPNGTVKTSRGGTWYTDANFTIESRVSDRGPQYMNIGFGFRVVRN